MVGPVPNEDQVAPYETLTIPDTSFVASTPYEEGNPVPISKISIPSQERI